MHYHIISNSSISIIIISDNYHKLLYSSVIITTLVIPTINVVIPITTFSINHLFMYITHIIPRNAFIVTSAFQSSIIREIFTVGSSTCCIISEAFFLHNQIEYAIINYVISFVIRENDIYDDIKIHNYCKSASS